MRFSICEHGLARLPPRGAGVGLNDDFADHQFGQLLLAGLGRSRARDDAAAPQHRDSIRDRDRLGQFVRDQHDDSAFTAQVAQQIEKGVQLRRREHAGRLVENQHARIEAERAQYFEPDALGDRAIFDGGAGGRQFESEFCRECARPRGDGREIEPLRGLVEAAEREIFLPRHPLEQHRALMHRRDSGSQRGARRARLQGRIVEASPRRASGASEPASTFIRVVLPAPFSPSSA